MNRLFIYPEQCIACGLCAVYAPEIFDYDDNGLVVLKKGSEKTSLSFDSLPEQLLTAYRKCPTGAIEIKKKT